MGHGVVLASTWLNGLGTAIVSLSPNDLYVKMCRVLALLSGSYRVQYYDR